MDKQTFGNYGWIVIVVLILGIMISFATPFGETIRDGVVSAINGFADKADGALTPDSPPGEKPDGPYAFSYYSSLKKAIGDINNGTTTSTDANSDTAVVGVYENEGRQTVVLMQDTTETTVIDITKDLDLNLGGYCLNLGSGAYINITNAASTVSVDGTLAGSAVKKELEEASSDSESLFRVSCKTFSVKGGEYVLNIATLAEGKVGTLFDITTADTSSIFDSCNAFANVDNAGPFNCHVYGISTREKVTCKISNCIISVSAGGSSNLCPGTCVQARGKLEVTDSELSASTIRGEASGIKSYGDLTELINSDILITSSRGIGQGVLCNYALIMSDCNISVSSQTTTGGGSQVQGLDLGGTSKITHSNISVDTGSQDGQGVFARGRCILEMANCDISVSSSLGNAYGIVNGGTSEVTNCEIYADATCHSEYEGESNGLSIGIQNKNTLTLNSCTAYGTHSGVENRGTLYVNGGTYSGTGHGGIYFANANKAAYVENAIIAAVPYDGQFKDVFYDELGHLRGAFYVGGGENFSNISVYLNNCVIENHDLSGTPSENCYAFILRGTSGEVNNSVYISNSTINGSQKIRIDNDTLKLYVGQNTNITADMTTRPGSVEITNEVYVKK